MENQYVITDWTKFSEFIFQVLLTNLGYFFVFNLQIISISY